LRSKSTTADLDEIESGRDFAGGDVAIRNAEAPLLRKRNAAEIQVRQSVSPDVKCVSGRYHR
jgi:hypothetical protein